MKVKRPKDLPVDRIFGRPPLELVVDVQLGSPEQRRQFARVHADVDASLVRPIRNIINLVVPGVGSER
jgi:hypothetical protein